MEHVSTVIGEMNVSGHSKCTTRERNEGVENVPPGRQKVTLQPGVALNLEEDSPELEAELLKAIDGPYTPYSTEEMRANIERIIRVDQT